MMSVLNSLMQLRKVCNHPNLFESRPIVSSLSMQPLAYSIPAMFLDLAKKRADVSVFLICF